MISKVVFVSQACAEAIGPWPNWAVISLRDSNAPYRAKINDGWNSVLYRCFDDVSPLIHGLDSPHAFMTEEDALKIVYFVHTVAPKVDGILIHCKSGISRSAAVAKWISGQFQIPFSNDYTHYNYFVYEMLCYASNESKYI